LAHLFSQSPEAGRAHFDNRCAKCPGGDGNGAELGPAIVTRIPLRDGSGAARHGGGLLCGERPGPGSAARGGEMQQPARLVVFLLALTGAASAQMQPVLGENTTKISNHVWAIMGFPNIGIVVGDRATLVVDTGLGPRNGATIVRVASKLSPNTKLFLTTTHFHPEHAGGEPGFPPGTILIRNTVQQQEMVELGAGMMDRFRNMSPLNKELLANVTLRTPDVLFDTEAKVDLGNVTVRLLWFGAGHTKGDELVFVEPDSTLISGDIVQNKVVPAIPGDGGSPLSWLAVLDKLAALHVQHVLPDHSEPGDGGLIAADRAFIGDLRARSLALKAQGISADDAGKQLTAEFKTKYPDWPNLNPLANFVRRVYTGPE
jgi:glyoxylase-like metal-dependent hydrolase (beta-lactamase superfamily II)